MTIGLRLKSEREKLGLSQTAMAEMAHTTKKTQIDHETDRTPPKATYLAQVASLGVDVGYVITGERLENVARGSVETSVLLHFRQLPTAQRYAVIKLLTALAGTDQPPPGWASF